MIIYLAGEGHTISKTPFVHYLIKRGWYCLLSYSLIHYKQYLDYSGEKSVTRVNYIFSYKRNKVRGRKQNANQPTTINGRPYQGKTRIGKE